MTIAERQQFIESLGAEQIELLLADWPLWARQKQMPPDGDWRIWLLLARRGFGKTRTGSECVRRLAGGQSGSMMTGQIGLVGDTFDDVRHVMVEGPAGILAISPRWARPDWQPSQRRLVWPNGVRARCFSADDPEQLRGPEFEFVWAEVIADSCGLLAFRLSDAAWTLLQIGLGGYVVGRSVEKIAPKMTGLADRDPRP